MKIEIEHIGNIRFKQIGSFTVEELKEISCLVEKLDNDDDTKNIHEIWCKNEIQTNKQILDALNVVDPIKIIEKRIEGWLHYKVVLEDMRYAESKIDDEKYHKENCIDNSDLEKDIKDSEISILECERIIELLKQVKLK